MTMPINDRVSDVGKLRGWKDSLPLHYEYTAGVAGEHFLRGLQQGKILAAQCKECGKMYIPPKIYCVDCFVAIDEYREVGSKGRVSGLTKSYEDFQGRKTATSRVFVFVTFKGVTGGLIHYGGEGLKVGSEVTAQFRPAGERKGTLLDIEMFATR
jgi:uncharacterized OB-fold protein